LSEILPRYRDDPWRAAFQNPHGISYWLINGLISHIVFFIAATVFWEELGLMHGGELAHGEVLKVSLCAGVGAMAFLRSKLFKITLKNGEEYSVGPDHIINALLASTNDSIDRFCGEKRTFQVKQKFSGLDYHKLKAHAQTVIFGGRQTLPEKEREAFARALSDIDSDNVSEEEKPLQLGYIILDYLGRDFVAKLELDGFRRKPPQPDDSVPPRPAEKKELTIRKLGQPPPG